MCSFNFFLFAGIEKKRHDTEVFKHVCLKISVLLGAAD